MSPRFFIFFLFFLSGTFTFAQQDYWQQNVQYEIRVKLDDQNHFLRGEEKFHYTNNSPETLEELYIHLWPNAYKDRTTAFAKQKLSSGSTKFWFAPEEDRGFIDSLDFQVDGQKVEWEFHEENWDIAHVKLNRPLKPGDQLVFTTPFRVKIPESFSRLGHVEQQYQICQWYPKPAVFDAKGWHPIPYLDQGEFYSEFGTFDVWIDLPANYVVGATGDLVDNELEEQFLKEHERMSVEFLELPDSEAVFPELFGPDERKVLHYHQENVHDFAWFCDKNYYRVTSLTELPGSNETVECVALFTNLEREYWGQIANKALENAITDYSIWNGDYPYKHVTAVEGALSAGAGMEYPNVTVVSAGGSSETLEEVIMHEVGHNWFYGILASNEREYPWMDEGLNSYMENRYWKKRHGDSLNMIPQAIQDKIGLNLTHSNLQQVSYRFSAGENTDQPIQFPAAEYTDINYGTIVYMKSARAFYYLEGYLTEPVISNCFLTYYDRWKFKHPQPDDIQAVFEEVSGEDLGWFFDGLLMGTEKIDFKITKIDGNTVTVKNNTGIPLPCPVSRLDENGEVMETIWTPVFEKTATVNFSRDDFHKVVIDPMNQVPEFRKTNNHRYNRALFAGARKPSFNFLYKYPDREKFHVGWLPTLGYNTTDGFMAGLLFHHGVYPKDRFEFHLMPMVGFKNFNLAGSAGATYRWLPNKVFRKIELHSRTSFFADLLRTRHFLEFYLDKPSGRSPMDQKLTLNLHHIGTRGNYDNYWQPAWATLEYDYSLKQALQDAKLNAELGMNYATNTYRGALTVDYHKVLGKKYDIRLRGFAGGFLLDEPVPDVLAIGLAGSGDPFGENILLDRNDNTTWLNNQVLPDHGGFRSLQTQRFGSYLATAGITADALGSFVQVYGDVGVGQQIRGGAQNLYSDAGLQLNLPLDILKVYFPVAGTQYADGLPANFGDFGRNIVFSLSFGHLLDRIPQ